MSIGHNEEAGRGFDSAKNLKSYGRREQSVQEPVGLRRGRSTMDAIRAVVDIVTKARRGTNKRKGFCTLASIDMRNVFNTARWRNCIAVMMRKKISAYLLRMMEAYLSNK